MRTACLTLGLSLILIVTASLSEPGSSTGGGQAAPFGCDEPDPIILDWAGWNMDMDGSRLDDRLESGAAADPISGGRIGINVHLDHSPTEGDVDSILMQAAGAGLEPDFIRAGRYTTAVYLTVDNMPPPSLALLTRMAGVTMVEYRPENILFNDVSAKAVRSSPSTDYSPYTAEDLGYSGSGVTVAVIDTGADDAAHESLRGKFVYGVDFTGATIVYGLNPDDIDGHGTHVAGTVMGTGGSSGTYRGVGPGADLVDIRFARVFGDVTGNGDQAIEWLIENHDEHGIRIASLSWGSTSTSSGRDTTSQLVNDLVEDGVVVVVAAGNDGTVGMPSPAAADGAITVGSVNDQNTVYRGDDSVEGYSNRGPRSSDGDGDRTDELKPDLVAPGTRIISAAHNTLGGYVEKTGTSMAAPQVSGVVSLMLEANPGLEPWQVKSILHATSQQRLPASLPDIDPKYNYRSGWGEVDAYGAVKRAADLASFRSYAPGFVTPGSRLYANVTGDFTKTSYDTWDEEMIVEMRVPLEWGPPEDVHFDSGMPGVAGKASEPVRTQDQWVVRGSAVFKGVVQECSPVLSARLKAPREIGAVGSIHGHATIDGISGKASVSNVTVASDIGLPDLSIVPMAIWFSDNRPEGGDEVQVTVRVNNTGGVDVPGALIRLLDGPEVSGLLIGEDEIYVPAGGSALAVFEWEASPGVHTITATADPDDILVESDETNNTAERPITVLGINPPPVAELSVSTTNASTFEEITYDASGSYDTNIRGGAVVSYLFDFGDQETSGWVNEPIIRHRYREAGNYQTTLVVKDNGGSTSSNDAQEVIGVDDRSTMGALYLNGSMELLEEPDGLSEMAVPRGEYPELLGEWSSLPVDRTVNLFSPVTFRGEISSEAPFNITIDLELLIADPDGVMLDRFTSSGSFTGGQGASSGFLEISVSDLELLYNSRISLTVRAASNTSSSSLLLGYGGSSLHLRTCPCSNLPPEVEAGGDIETKAGRSVEFAGNVSDPDGDVIRTRWDFDGDGVWDAEGEDVRTYIYEGYAEEGAYQAIFEARDDDGWTARDSLTVTVHPSDHNFAPTIIIDCEDGTVITGEVLVEGTAEDDGRVERVEVRVTGPRETGGSEAVTWTGAEGTGEWSLLWDTLLSPDGTYSIQARAFDGERYSAVASCEVQVLNPNHPPRILNLTHEPDPLPLDGRTMLTLTAEVEDLDMPGDSILVRADLSPLGGEDDAVLLDDGGIHDDLAGDGEYTLSFVPDPMRWEPSVQIFVEARDSTGRTDSGYLTIALEYGLDVVVRLDHRELARGDNLVVEVEISPYVQGAQVDFRSTAIGDRVQEPLPDDGRGVDKAARDGVFSAEIALNGDPGEHNYTISVRNSLGDLLYEREGDGTITLEEPGSRDGIGSGTTFQTYLLVVIAAIALLAVIGLIVYMRVPGLFGRMGRGPEGSPTEMEAPVYDTAYPISPVSKISDTVEAIELG